MNTALLLSCLLSKSRGEGIKGRPCWLMFESRGSSELIPAVPQWHCGETWHGITHSQVEIGHSACALLFGMCIVIWEQCDCYRAICLFQPDSAAKITPAQLFLFTLAQTSNENHNSQRLSSLYLSQSCNSCSFYTLIKYIQVQIRYLQTSQKYFVQKHLIFIV